MNPIDKLEVRPHLSPTGDLTLRIWIRRDADDREYLAVTQASRARVFRAIRSKALLEEDDDHQGFYSTRRGAEWYATYYRTEE